MARAETASEARHGLVGDENVRFIGPRILPVERATDLGSVQVLKHGNLFLLTDPFGDMHPDSRGLGLYDRDTRLLSCSTVRINGTRPVLLQGSMGGNYQGVIQMTNASIDRNPDEKVIGNEDGLAGRKLGIARHRIVSNEGLEERLTVVNFAEEAEAVDVEIELGTDAADIFEVRGYPRAERGSLLPAAVVPGRVTFRYDGLDGRRRSTYLAFSAPEDSVSAVDLSDGRPDQGGWLRLSWSWPLAPGESRELSWSVWGDQEEIGQGREATTPLFPPAPRIDAAEGAGAYHAWNRGTTIVGTDHELFNLTVARSVADLRLLMNEGPHGDERYIAAGVPWFSALFGRDAIITAFQSLAFRPQLAIETLHVLAARQATTIDDVRDAEPGKILHELRVGEMASAGELPHTPYYGSVDSTPLWLILLGATFDWTGDRYLVDRLWPHALAALHWIDTYGDLDGDGFVEYRRRTERGLLNQGWKDSHDAIRDRNGREAPLPIALVEVQGYVFDAKRRMAKLARMRGEPEFAARLEAEAEALRVRFEKAFWVEDQRYYALGLDGDKRPADAIGSNAGQCLWTGIIDPKRARDVADRLLEPSMFSGWGVRTYAAGQPGYNPIGYHTGSVWPHDTSLIAAGLKRYGFDDESNRVVSDVFRAAQHFPEYRLPELFCGFDRDHAATPVPYPVACSPQAWAAGASFLFLETMLGLRAHADRRELELHHPNLPDWLGKVTLTNLRVGEASVDLLFHRWRGTTSAEVLRKVGDIAVTIRI
jgi:glycogen debranching enzyme